MGRKRAGIFFIGLLLISASGCFALLAGGAAGGGTAAWLSGKLVQQVDTPFDRAVSAARSGLQSLNLGIAKETLKKDVAQFKSEYTDGKTVWVDLHRITDTSTKIEVRVGAVSDKGAAEKILQSIKRYL
jgi:hypothetical protein